ncbi:monooxygenase [Immersiella caudata]|uniref:Monooxygenase n=1 Tax=Immersiella caudata TaxID=314043 RepID=A0AA39WRT4_9PEZI|nr:monooxygenase [Immersiella caudata]
MPSVASKLATDEPVGYSQFACIGAGFSGIGLGASLKRRYGITNIRLFERESDLGGTWMINQYPGCACDIPSILYSYSFETNPAWDSVLPPRADIQAYLRNVAAKYDLIDKISFNTSVEKCEWVEEKGRWRMTVRDNASGHPSVHEAQFVFSGVGLFSKPRIPEIPGLDSFKGPVVHTARWPQGLNLKDRKVIVLGNGCSASQVVPAILDEAASITQIVRTKHWIIPNIKDTFNVSPLATLTKHAPWTRGLQRSLLFWLTELQYPPFLMNRLGGWLRSRSAKAAENNIRATAPEKYHDLLIPDFEMGYKRRIFDPGYLKSLKSDKITLTDEAVFEIISEGIRTGKGIIEADVIICATGFHTNRFLVDIDVVGRNAENLQEHWSKIGGPSAYDCCAVSGFPNFFFLCGPNSGTGHTTLTIAIENAINLALRLIKPVLDGKATSVEVKRDAEEKYTRQLQADLKKMVWGAQKGHTWYLDGSGTGWNASMYPWWQIYAICRSFPTWRDWNLQK